MVTLSRFNSRTFSHMILSVSDGLINYANVSLSSQENGIDANVNWYERVIIARAKKRCQHIYYNEDNWQERALVQIQYSKMRICAKIYPKTRLNRNSRLGVTSHWIFLHCPYENIEILYWYLNLMHGLRFYCEQLINLCVNKRFYKHLPICHSLIQSMKIFR